MKNRLFTLIVALLLFAGLAVFLVTFEVREGSFIILTTFGKPVKVIAEPGLYWQLPWPAQKAESYERRIQVFNGRAEQTLTRDQKNIIVTATVGWRIANDPRSAIRFREALASEPAAEDKLRAIVSSRKNEVIGRHDLADFVSTDSAAMKLRQIEEEMRQDVSKAVNAEYGLDVKLLRIKILELPESVIDKVHERMKSERQTEINQFTGQAQAISEQIRSTADAERQNIIALANKEAQAIRGRADAEAVEFYKELAQLPELAAWLRAIRALEAVTKDRTTVVLDAGNSLLEAISKDIVLPEITPSMAPAPANNQQKGG